jgi:hypothetical protein
MGKIKGAPKTGGRKAGTPNKVTGTIKDFLSNLIDRNRDQIEADLKKLQPKDRLIILERLLQYVVPKTALGDNVQEIPDTLEVRIVDVAPEYRGIDFASSEDEVDCRRQ